MTTQTSAKTSSKLADFRPFRAWRYDLSRVQAKDVLAPPYDVISPQEQDALYARSPYNCIRLILNKILESDTDSDNRYTRARDFFSHLKSESVITREDKPCFYLYQQRFTDPQTGRQHSRTAFLGALKLEPFDRQIVIPHEKTLAKPRADRRRLLETTRTNFSPVFGLFEDAQNRIVPMIPSLSSGTPLFDVTDEKGVSHALWCVSDEDKVQRLREAVGHERIYIADGHHRYQTSLEYSLERRAEAGVQADQELPSDFTYMALVSFHDSGLVLFPTHRLLTGVADFDAAKLLESLKTYFDLEAVKPADLMPRVEKASEKTSALGLALSASEGYVLSLKDEAKARAAMLDGKPDVWYKLDVNVFAYLILKKILGLSETQWESHLQFTHADDEAVREISDRKVQAAFLLKAPKVSVLADMGKVRELMPQKSTYFYPKLASGLLFYQHEAGSVA
ncbi:MAG: DUF1015 domain-containing protein [Candidatus Omnitrophica bacterium]|nr:DUF1015 domain-containing protein [Candidatus Omnitrophota bacterium]